MTGTHLINRKRARCQRFGAAARREEGVCNSRKRTTQIRAANWQGLGSPYPLWIFDRRATQQRRKRSATRRAAFWRASGGVAPQSQSAAAMLLRRALPVARQKTARPFPIYEMGSKRINASAISAQRVIYHQGVTPARQITGTQKNRNRFKNPAHDTQELVPTE